MSAPAQPARLVERYVLVMGGAAALVYGVILASLAWVPPSVLLTPGNVLVAGLLASAYVAFQFFAFEFEWRGHWLTANLDEMVLFLGLVLLPGPAAIALIPVAEVVVHFVSRRPLVKGVFNVSQLVVACAAAWDAFALLRWVGAPPILAGAAAVPAYVVTSNLLLSGVFARLEGERTLRVYWQRFAPTTVVLTIVGIAGGVSVLGLASLHPLAVVALVPFAYSMHRNAVLTSRADRELRVHRALADGSTALVDKWSLDAVADHVLAACADTLPVGRATLTVGERSWTREFEGGPAPGATYTMVELRGRDGSTLGTLSATSRPGQREFGEDERALLRVVAGQASAAVLNVHAVLALEEAHKAALAQQDRLAKNEKLSALGMLIANVAHEIGNPLSYMRLSLQTSKMQADRLAASADPEVRKAAEALQKGIATAQKGTNNVVEISNSLRAVARQGPPGFKPLDLNAVASDVANVVRVGFAKDVAIRVELAEGAVMLNGNAGELTQVALNLAKNAAEAMEGRAGTVTLRTERSGDRVRLLVADDGPGIPPEVLAKLFQAFVTTKEQGTGIGLHISQGIARKHGGDLTCQTAVGQGTTFTLDLPSLAADPSVSGLPQAAPLAAAPESQHP